MPKKIPRRAWAGPICPKKFPDRAEHYRMMFIKFPGKEGYMGAESGKSQIRAPFISNFAKINYFKELTVAFYVGQKIEILFNFLFWCFNNPSHVFEPAFSQVVMPFGQYHCFRSLNIRESYFISEKSLLEFCALLLVEVP